MKKILNFQIFINVILAIIGITSLVGAVNLFALFISTSVSLSDIPADQIPGQLIWTLIAILFASFLLLATIIFYVLRYLLHNKNVEIAGIIITLSSTLFFFVFVCSTGNSYINFLQYFIYYLILCALIDVPSLIKIIKGKKQNKNDSNDGATIYED